MKSNKHKYAHEVYADLLNNPNSSKLKSYDPLVIYSLVINRKPTTQDKLDLDLLLSKFKTVPKATLNYLMLLSGVEKSTASNISLLIAQMQGFIAAAIDQGCPLKAEALYSWFKKIGKTLGEDTVNKLFKSINQD